MNFLKQHALLEIMKEKKAEDYFADVAPEVRAAFELGIKFGTLFHTSIGRPVRNDPNTISAMEKGIESSIACQPYVQSVSVKIVGDPNTSKEFEYGEITGKNLFAEIIVSYKNIRIHGTLKWIPELNYPLMFISNLEKTT